MRSLNPSIRNLPPVTAVLAVLLWFAPLVGCKSTSSPTKPDPEPAQGRVELALNDSSFRASASAGFDCEDARLVEPDESDFAPTFIDFDVSCSAIAQGELHSATMKLVAALTYQHDGPDGSLSEIRFAAEAIGNRSATGLASNSATTRMRLRFAVTGDPVAYRVVGTLTYGDSFYDWIDLRVVGAPNGQEIVHDGGQGHGVVGTLDFDESGILPVGDYEVRVDLTTLDWFTEEIEFALLFSAPSSR